LLRIIPSLALFEVALLYRRFAEIPGFDRIFKWPEAITIHRRLLWSPLIQCLFLNRLPEAITIHRRLLWSRKENRFLKKRNFKACVRFSLLSWKSGQKAAKRKKYPVF
jgi:hypothetical protein